MRYVCLVHFDGTKLDAMPEAARRAFDQRSMGYDRELEARGHFVLAEALQSADQATLVQVREGKMSATDGPFIETKEALAGFIVIEARDMNEAVRLAAGIPLAELGTIEVRPVYNFG